jgi:hypothetical protein
MSQSKEEINNQIKKIHHLIRKIIIKTLLNHIKIKVNQLIKH